MFNPAVHDSHPGDGRRPDDRPPLLLWLPHIVLVVLQILKQQRGHRLETTSCDASRPIRRRLGDPPVPAGRRRWPPAPRRSSRIPRLSSYLRRWEDVECGRCLMNISQPLFSKFDKLPRLWMHTACSGACTLPDFNCFHHD